MNYFKQMRMLNIVPFLVDVDFMAVFPPSTYHTKYQTTLFPKSTSYLAKKLVQNNRKIPQKFILTCLHSGLQYFIFPY